MAGTREQKLTNRFSFVINKVFAYLSGLKDFKLS